MNILFYPRLVLSGMRRDRRIYAPSLAACVFMTAVVYDLAFLADSPSLYAVGSGVNGMGTSAIRLVMTLGKWVMAVFALLFFFYTNAFLIRRRKKELGLMSVLGMDRGALTSLLFWETAFSALVSLTAGLALGVLLTQLSARVLSHFARTELPALPLLDLGAVRFCVLTDAFIFFLLLLNAWRQVRRASAVSLLRSDSLGERPPRSQWLLVLSGLGLLGGAYYLAVTITEPITAMLVFFVAVVMVILATFLLFIAGSVTLCRTLQGNDRFYYQKKNFVALSSLVYRMKRSGAGLAVICILSTMILVMLGSTAGLYFGAEDVVRTLSAEMSREIAAEAGLAVDEAAFHVEMTRQRERARAERLAKDISGWSEDLFGELNAEPTEFDGYDVLKETAKVLALSDGEELNDAVSTDYEERENVLVVLDRTPFYAEMGGQVADHGYLTSGTANLKVNQVKKTPKGFYVHTCTLLDGTIRVGDTVTAAVDEQRRASICRNHTATHLMQKALREVLGEHVHQAGSYQDDKITRFDFTHFNAVTPEELVEVEKRVNEKIFASLPVTIQNLPIEEAKKMGAMALFGEKYGKVVRVVDAGGWSVEFCGGTHVKNTAQIGCFKILSEASVAAGIRRIEATTGYGVLNLLDDRTAELANTAVALKANNMKDVAARAQAVTAELKEANKQLEIAKAKLASSQIDGLFQNAVEVDGVRIVTVYLNGTTPDTLRSMMDKLRDKEPNAVGALIGTDGSKTTLAVGVGKNALARGLKAGALVKQIAAIAGGNGGGKPDFAMAGIRDTSKIDDALNAVEGIVKENLEKAN